VTVAANLGELEMMNPSPSGRRAATLIPWPTVAASRYPHRALALMTDGDTDANHIPTAYGSSQRRSNFRRSTVTAGVRDCQCELLCLPHVSAMRCSRGLLSRRCSFLSGSAARSPFPKDRRAVVKCTSTQAISRRLREVRHHIDVFEEAGCDVCGAVGVVRRVGALVLVYRRCYSAARGFAVAAVGAVVAGWSVGQYPWMLADELNFADAAAAKATLEALLIVVGLAVVIALPALTSLLRLIQTDNWSRGAVDTAVNRSRTMESLGQRHDGVV
jgi:hypothetical protein